MRFLVILLLVAVVTLAGFSLYQGNRLATLESKLSATPTRAAARFTPFTAPAETNWFSDFQERQQREQINELEGRMRDQEMLRRQEEINREFAVPTPVPPPPSDFRYFR